MSTLASAESSWTLGLALADTSEGDCGQLYLLPSLERGRFAVGTTLEWYEPLERAGTRRLWANPVTVLWRWSDRLRIGGAAVSGVGEGARPTHRAGPMLQLDTPRGSSQVELFEGLVHADPELRVAYQASF